jgi:hypothetical protein
MLPKNNGDQATGPFEPNDVSAKMGGGGRPHLLETDDGAYVVKFFNNHQGHHILTNEFISSFLMQTLGLMTPDQKQ